MSERAAVHLVEGLGEVHYNDIDLDTYFGVVCEFLEKF